MYRMRKINYFGQELTVYFPRPVSDALSKEMFLFTLSIKKLCKELFLFCIFSCIGPRSLTQQLLLNLQCCFCLSNTRFCFSTTTRSSFLWNDVIFKIVFVAVEVTTRITFIIRSVIQKPLKGKSDFFFGNQIMPTKKRVGALNA